MTNLLLSLEVKQNLSTWPRIYWNITGWPFYSSLASQTELGLLLGLERRLIVTGCLFWCLLPGAWGHLHLFKTCFQCKLTPGEVRWGALEHSPTPIYIKLSQWTNNCKWPNPGSQLRTISWMEVTQILLWLLWNESLVAYPSPLSSFPPFIYFFLRRDLLFFINKFFFGGEGQLRSENNLICRMLKGLVS